MVLNDVELLVVQGYGAASKGCRGTHSGYGAQSAKKARLITTRITHTARDLRCGLNAGDFPSLTESEFATAVLADFRLTQHQFRAVRAPHMRFRTR